MTKVFSLLHRLVWGAPALTLILGVGMFLSFRTGFAQLTLFPRAAGAFFRRLLPGRKEGGVSSFQALCTALAATVGTGNLVGVAGAICLGGPGAVFWMWICAIFGMVTKYAEAVLAVRFRVKTAGGFIGGPMYVISQGLGPRWRMLANAYCLFGIVAAFGVGNAAQINAVRIGVNTLLARGETFAGNLALGLILAVVLGFALLGGAKRIGAAAERIVPFGAVGYILLCLGVLAARWEAVPEAMASILEGAFCPRAVTGGALGSAFGALRVGCSRGVFTNEAGMGTAAIAHASAEVSHPAEQGLMGIMEVFLDTIVICTLTALVILVSGAAIPYGTDAGAELTTAAFAAIYGEYAALLIAAFLILFAVATVLGWSLYGGRCAQFLFGEKGWNRFLLAQTCAIVLAATADTATVWQVSEILNGLMAIPNLITLAVLTPEVARLTKEYKESGPK